MFSVLAFDADQPVGLINAIEGFSTFACKPLINIHDVIVLRVIVVKASPRPCSPKSKPSPKRAAPAS